MTNRSRLCPSAPILAGSALSADRLARGTIALAVIGRRCERLDLFP